MRLRRGDLVWLWLIAIVFVCVAALATIGPSDIDIARGYTTCTTGLTSPMSDLTD